MKNKNLNFLLLLMFFCSCGNQIETPKKTISKDIMEVKSSVEYMYDDGLTITIDTLDFSHSEWTYDLTFFQDKYYGIYETPADKPSDAVKHVLILDKNGQPIRDLILPQSSQDNASCLLKIDNDSLFFYDPNKFKSTYILDESTFTFKEVNKKYYTLYEDETYRVIPKCNGEFMGTAYFQNKQTLEFFEVAANCPKVINKIKDDYYLTNSNSFMGVSFNSLMKISNPDELHQSDFDYKHRNGSFHRKGIELLLDSMDIFIQTSFVVGEELRHLYSNEEGTYIGRVENGKLIPIYKFDFVFNSFIDEQKKNGDQVLHLYFRGTKRVGSLFIEKGNFTFKLFQ